MTGTLVRLFKSCNDNDISLQIFTIVKLKGNSLSSTPQRCAGRTELRGKPFSGLRETEHKLLSERIFSLGFGATGKGKIFLYSTAPKTCSGVQPASYLMGYRVLFPGGKAAGA
jgi:hypothetical protein